MKILRTENLKVRFTQHKRAVRALDGVDFFLKKGAVTALAGESGCGKTTLARAILRFHRPDEGKIYFQGEDITLKRNEPLIRKNIQVVFQNPFLSVDPRYTVFSILYEALNAFRKVRKPKAKEVIVNALSEVELNPDVMSRYPHQLSGGQLQRVCIARALINKPSLIILDEPTSALDIVTASKIMALLKKIRENSGITFLFISHNLRLLGKISDFCFIMYYGKIMEYGSKELVFKNPLHPYTKLLIEASYYKLRYLESREVSFGEGETKIKEAEPGHFVSCR